MTTKTKFRTRRQKQLRGTTYPLVFTWEGGEYIDVAFPGCYAHDTINVWDNGKDAPLIERTDAAFKTEVNDYLAHLDDDPAAVAEEWQNRTAR